MPWKTVEVGEGEGKKIFVEISQEGDPVWLEDDGEENPIDWPRATKKINELVRGEKNIREKLKEVEDGYATFRGKFNGIDDPEAAIKAIEFEKKMAAKKMIDAGEVDKLKEQMNKAYGDQILALEKSISDTKKLMEDTVAAKDSEIHALVVSNRFASSPFIKEKLILPADITEQVFGKHFKVEDGKPVGYFSNGEKIISNKHPGDQADFDEALAILVDGYVNKDHILRGNNQSGGGMKGSDAGAGGAKTYTKLSDFSSREEKVAFIKEHGGAAYQKIVDASK